MFSRHPLTRRLSTTSTQLLTSKNALSNWTVTLALLLKNLDLRPLPPHKSPQFSQPTLHIDGTTLVGPLAILRFLEENIHSGLSLLPREEVERELVVCWVQRLSMSCEVFRFYQETEAGSEERSEKYPGSGFRAWDEEEVARIERGLIECAGVYTVGDNITMADLYLYPRIKLSNKLFNKNIENTVHLRRVIANLDKFDEFVNSTPQ